MKTYNLKVEKWNIEEETGYKPLFTFYEDFSIAEPFGASAIEETFDRTFEEWKGDHKALTELVMALNWKVWILFERGSKLAEVYSRLWNKADNYAVSHLKGEELQYFYRTTD